MRILVAGYGLAAHGILRSLLLRHGVPKDNLICFTYDIPGNEGLLQFLRETGVEWSIERLGTGETIGAVNAFAPDVIASLYYRHIIPPSVLRVARQLSFNVHPSLLPEYKGCFSAPWALINQESETGITFHEMIEKVDSGRILWQKRVAISPGDTAYSLYHRLMSACVSEFDLFFRALVRSEIEPAEMLGGGRTYGRAVPEGGIIDQSWGGDRIDAFIRALFFPPHEGAVVELQGRRVEVSTYREYLELVNGGAR